MIKFRRVGRGPRQVWRDARPDDQPRADRLGDTAARRPPAQPRLRQPQPAAGQDRDGRLRHGLHAGALQPGAHRGAVDARDAAQAGDGEGLSGGDPGAGLRSDAGGARPGRRPRQRQHLQARSLRLPGTRAPRAVDDRSFEGRRALPARAHAAVEPALRLDRFAVRAARGGAVRVPGRLLRSPRDAREARLHDAVGAHPRVHRPRAPRRIDQGDRQRAAAGLRRTRRGAGGHAAQVPLVGEAAVPAHQLGVGLHRRR